MAPSGADARKRLSLMPLAVGGLHLCFIPGCRSAACDWMCFFAQDGLFLICQDATPVPQKSRDWALQRLLDHGSVDPGYSLWGLKRVRNLVG